MAAGPTSNRLLLEIVPPLKSGGRPLVVGQVHRLLSREGETRWPKGQRNALLLVALSYQLARRLLEDLALTPQPLAPRRWRWKLCPGSERIRAGEIVWSVLATDAVECSVAPAAGLWATPIAAAQNTTKIRQKRTQYLISSLIATAPARHRALTHPAVPDRDRRRTVKNSGLRYGRVAASDRLAAG